MPVNLPTQREAGLAMHVAVIKIAVDELGHDGKLDGLVVSAIIAGLPDLVRS